MNINKNFAVFVGFFFLHYRILQVQQRTKIYAAFVAESILMARKRRKDFMQYWISRKHEPPYWTKTCQNEE